MSDPGYIVRMKSGERGRTYHSKGKINGKVPVYKISEIKPGNPGAVTGERFLCKPENLTMIGFID